MVPLILGNPQVTLAFTFLDRYDSLVTRGPSSNKARPKPFSMGNLPKGLTWIVPKVRGTFLGVPIIRIIGLYWGPPILGNYHMGLSLVFHGLFGMPWETCTLWRPSCGNSVSGSYTSVRCIESSVSLQIFGHAALYCSTCFPQACLKKNPAYKNARTAIPATQFRVFSQP